MISNKKILSDAHLSFFCEIVFFRSLRRFRKKNLVLHKNSFPSFSLFLPNSCSSRRKRLVCRRIETRIKRMCIGWLLDVVDVVRGCFKVKLRLCGSNSKKLCKLTQVHPLKNYEQVHTSQRLGSNLLRHICCRIKIKTCRVMIIIWCHKTLFENVLVPGEGLC